jgi:anti-sigma factor RsiW
MTGRPEAVTTEELHAYVDGALDAARRARVEAHLATHPDDAAAVRDYQRQNEALRALAASLDRTPGASPFRMRRPAPWRRSAWGRFGAPAFGRAGVVRALPWAAAVAGLLVLGAAGGWWARGAAEKPELYRLAASAYSVYTVQQRHPVEVWANERDHMQTWLGHVLGTPFVAPELAQQGYELVGGRLLSTTHGAAALLIYQDKNAQRLALFVSPKAAWGEKGKAAYEAVGPLGTFTWPKGPLWYSLAGTLKADELKSMAVSVNRQVSAAAPASPTVASHL